MKRSTVGFRGFPWLGSVIVLGSILTSTAAIGASTTTEAARPSTATQPATSASQPVASRLLAAGIERALGGQFAQSIEQLRRAVKQAPDSGAAKKALVLVEQYVDWRGRHRAEQAAEYAEAVQRVRRSFLAQEYLPTLEKNGLAERLRAKMLELASAYDEADDIDSLDLASPETAQRSKQKAAKAMDKATKCLDEALKLLKADHSKYADTFRELVGELRRRLTGCKKAWEAVRTETPEQRHVGAMELRAAANAVSDAMAGLEAMIAEKPWRVGLVQARLAKELVAGGGDVRKEDWYRKLVSDVEALGERAIQEADWYEALHACAGLSELEKDNETYEQRIKTIRRHVRVLSLYGGGGSGSDAEPDTQPAAEPRWKGLVKGVDVKMVRTAIVQVGENYVSPVDYRRAAKGALMSVKILAETPQVAESFALLKNDDKRRAFIEAVEGEISNVEDRERVDHMDLQYVLNNVIHASERTIEIPIPVLAVEFMEGMLDEMDRFSSMVWPAEIQDFRKQMTGQFYGVGIQISKEEGEPLRVVTPLPGTPAFRAGVKTGDLILAVDGRKTRDLGLDKLVAIIMGEKGTKVTLTLKRPGLLKPIDVEIVRDRIRIRTVKGWQRESNGEWAFTIDRESKIGYVRLTQFTDQTDQDMATALKKMKAAGLKGLVLDLRFNPGGLLRSAAKVADEFLRRGVTVSTKGRNTPRRAHRAGADGSYLDGDLVVLVNEASASAAEIVSGALKDWRRGIIVGRRTYGKGSVQTVIPINRQRAFLKLTTSYYYLPSGRLLPRTNGAKDWGVDPDVKILVSPKQMRRWLEIRYRTGVIQDIDPEILKSDLARQFEADIQLNTALLLLKLMQLKNAGPAA